MKRNKKPNKAASGQLCLFETPFHPAAGGEGPDKTPKEPRSALKTRRPYLYTTRTG